MAFKLADLFVQITGNAKPLNSTLVLVQQQLMGMSGLGGQIGASIAQGIAGPLLGLSTKGALAAGIGVIAAAAGTAALGKMAMMAAHLDEALAKTEQTFGSASGKIVGLADEMASKYGVVKHEIYETASAFGLMLQGAGANRKRSAEMSEALVRATLDAKSFIDVPLNEAITRMQSGLAGETEAVRRWGINVTEAAVEQKAMMMGLKRTGKEFGQNEKVMARYELILQGLRAASGDMERSQGRLVAQWDRFTGQLTNIATAIGSVVKPAFTALLQVGNAALTGLGSAFGWLSEKVRQIAFVMGYAFENVWSALRQDPLINMWIVGLTKVGQLVGYIISEIGGLFSWLDEQWNSFVKSLGYGGADANKTAELSGIDARIDQANERQKAEAARAAAMGKKEKTPFHGGLEDYAKKVAEAAAGNKTDTAKQQLAAQKDQLAIQKLQLQEQMKANRQGNGAAVRSQTNMGQSLTIGEVECWFGIGPDGQEGGIQESYSLENGPEARCTLKCAWTDRQTLIQALLGTVTYANGTVQRKPPFAYPLDNSMVVANQGIQQPNRWLCTGVGPIRGTKWKTDDDGDLTSTGTPGWGLYEWAVFEAIFTVPLWQVDEFPAGTQGIDISNFPYVVTKTKTSGEVFAPPTGAVIYQGGNFAGKALQDVNASIIRTRTEISLTLVRFPVVPQNLISELNGSVNSNPLQIATYTYPRLGSLHQHQFRSAAGSLQLRHRPGRRALILGKWTIELHSRPAGRATSAVRAAWTGIISSIRQVPGYLSALIPTRRSHCFPTKTSASFSWRQSVKTSQKAKVKR